MTTTQYYVRLDTAEQFGPADRDGVLAWAREGRIPKNAMLVDVADGSSQSVMEVEDLARILHAPPTVGGQIASTAPKGSFMIPSGNMPAVIGYYIAVGSILIWPLGPVAVIMGFFGASHALRKPECRGMIHAIVAILLGLFTSAVMVLLVIYLPRL